MNEPKYQCVTCGEIWELYELHGPATDLRCGDVTCGGSVVEVAQPLDE
jgi:hypothetical protein